MATIRELAGEHVEVEVVHRDIALDAPFGGALVGAMTAALATEDPGARVLPYCLSGGTDNKTLSRLGITGYGFAPCVYRRPRFRSHVPRHRRARGGRPRVRRQGAAPTGPVVLTARPVRVDGRSVRDGRGLVRAGKRPAQAVRVARMMRRRSQVRLDAAVRSGCGAAPSGRTPHGPRASFLMSARDTSRVNFRTRYSYSTIARHSHPEPATVGA